MLPPSPWEHTVKKRSTNKVTSWLLADRKAWLLSPNQILTKTKTQAHKHSNSWHLADVFRAESYSAAQPSEMQPQQLHGGLWTAWGWDRSLFYRRRHPRNPRPPGETSGREGEGRREEEGGSRGSWDTVRNLIPLLKRRGEKYKQGLDEEDVHIRVTVKLTVMFITAKWVRRKSHWSDQFSDTLTGVSIVSESMYM